MEFSKENILVDVAVNNKNELFAYISQYAFEKEIVDNPEKLVEAFLEREAEASTGLRDSFAIPHAKLNVIKKHTVLFIKLSHPIEWETFDDEPVSNIFALLVPSHSEGTTHLEMISKIATSLLEDDFKETIKNSSDINELQKQIVKAMKGEF